MGIPALGWMVERTDEATKLFGDDLLRRMAGSLLNEQQRAGTRVLSLSSIKPGGGASEMVLSLARTLDALGYPTLAVEANAFRRDLRYAGDRPGLAECLRGEVAPAACVTPAQGDLQARVHIGDLGGQSHLDRLDRIAEVTQAWGQDFRFVLVDLPPLLLSADAEILVRNLQHLIVIIEASDTVAGELRRAGRQLEKLDPASVGIVLNRVRPFDGGGYLRGAMFEYLSGRKLSEYYTTSSWVLGAQAHLIAFQMRHPTLGALAERVLSLFGKLSPNGRRQAARGGRPDASGRR